MSMWNPNARSNSPYLTVQFNQHVSKDAYSRARDEVLLTTGVKLASEDSENRTMLVTAARGTKYPIENITGVESCTRG